MTLATLPPPQVPEANPASEAKTALGEQLFYDKRLSADGKLACASCHKSDDGTGGHDPIAMGPKDKSLKRQSPVLWNLVYLSRFFWDGRADSLEAATTEIWEEGMGVGKEKLDAKAKEIGKVAGYKKQFDQVFPGKGATPETIAQALAAYQRTLVCDKTNYDKYAKGDKSALNDKQKQGLELFFGKAGCVTCHTPPHFSLAYFSKDAAFFDIGVGIKDKKEEDVDVGRMGVTKAATDWAAFKPPTLRGVAKSAPYFHDGSVAKLEDAVRFMAGGGFPNKNHTPLLSDKKLSDDEISHIADFLGSLSCPNELKEPKLP
jgi:cytochrome c peroxidase